MYNSQLMRLYIESANDTKDIDNFQLETLIKNEITKEMLKKYKDYEILDEKEIKDDEKIDIEKEKKAKNRLKFLENKFQDISKTYHNFKSDKQNFQYKYPVVCRLIRAAITILVVILTWKIAGVFVLKKLGGGLIAKVASFIAAALAGLLAAIIGLIVNKKLNEKQAENIIGFYKSNADYLDKKIENCEDEEDKLKLKNTRYQLEKGFKQVTGKYYEEYKIRLKD